MGKCPGFSQSGTMMVNTVALVVLPEFRALIHRLVDAKMLKMVLIQLDGSTRCEQLLQAGRRPIRRLFRKEVSMAFTLLEFSFTRTWIEYKSARSLTTDTL
jgi:hypothetical protein